MAKIFYGWNIGKETSSKQNVVGSWLKVNAPVVTHVLSMVVLALKKTIFNGLHDNFVKFVSLQFIRILACFKKISQWCHVPL